MHRSAGRLRLLAVYACLCLPGLRQECCHAVPALPVAVDMETYSVQLRLTL